MNIEELIKSTVRQAVKEALAELPQRQSDTRMLSLKNFSEQFDIPERTVRERIRNNQMSCAYQIGSRWYIDVGQFVESVRG